MKAISLFPDWAMLVALGIKRVECRSWRTGHIGDLLVCSSGRKVEGCVGGHALCVVSLDYVAPFTRSDVSDAFMEGLDFPKGSFAWHLSNPRLVKPFPVKGRQRLFDVNDCDIDMVGEPSPDAVNELLMPLVYKRGSEDSDFFWDMALSELGWL